MGLTGEEGEARIRTLFRRMGPLLGLARLLGLTAKMTAGEHALVNIDANAVGAASAPVIERLSCPVRFVLGAGDSLGARRGEMDVGRASLEPILARNPNVTVQTVSSNHTAIVKKDAGAIAQAVRDVAALAGAK